MFVQSRLGRSNESQSLNGSCLCRLPSGGIAYYIYVATRGNLHYFYIIVQYYTYTEPIERVAYAQ